MRTARLFLFFLLCSGTTAVLATELTFQSGPRQTLMIELYTSEGCNSCPPAESFLNSFVADKQLWQTYIPLAFHVDYWDYLGWRDKFATPANTQRQQRYGKALQSPTIYTPEFFVNGKEWRRGVFGRLPAVSTQEVGILRVVLSDSQLTARFNSSHAYTHSLQLHVAILGMELSSEIGAGENAGRHTTHQFVVLGQTQITSDKPLWQTSLPVISRVQPRQTALVVWVSESGAPAPLQATGGFIPK